MIFFWKMKNRIATGQLDHLDHLEHGARLGHRPVVTQACSAATAVVVAQAFNALR